MDPKLSRFLKGRAPEKNEVPPQLKANPRPPFSPLRHGQRTSRKTQRKGEGKALKPHLRCMCIQTSGGHLVMPTDVNHAVNPFISTIACSQLNF